MAALGRATSGVDYVDAVQRRHEHTRRLTTFFESYDLLLTPTLATPPPKIGEFDLPVVLQRGADVLLKTRTARHAALHQDRRRHGGQEPRLGAVHAAGEYHRAARDHAAAALDGGRSAARRSVRRPTGRASRCCIRSWRPNSSRHFRGAIGSHRFSRP